MVGTTASYGQGEGWSTPVGMAGLGDLSLDDLTGGFSLQTVVVFALGTYVLYQVFLKSDANKKSAQKQTKLPPLESAQYKSFVDDEDDPEVLEKRRHRRRRR